MLSMCLWCVLPFTACGGGKANSATPLSGNWQMTLTRDQTSSIRILSGFLLQSQSSLTGNLLLSGETNCAGVGSASGNVKGSNLTLTVAETGQTVNLTGSASSDGTSMNGSYSIYSSPCGGTQTGSWTGTQVRALQGNLRGTFTSTYPTYNGQTFQFIGMIAQAANTGGSAANLSGNITTENPCFGAASVSGQISGTAVVLNLVSDENVAMGKINGTMTVDAASITGDYRIFNAETPAVGGCQDYGTATITLQQ